MTTLGFREPLLLFCLPLIVGLGGVIFLWFERQREGALVLLGVGAGPQRWRRIGGPSLLCAVLLIALSRPYLGFHDVKNVTRGGDLMIVLDTSLSMEAGDATPSRLEAAKRKVLDTIDWIASHGQGTRVGITLFAGSAHSYCPLTADYDVVRQFAQTVQSSFITRGGSGLSAALESSLRSLQQEDSSRAAIMLLSDGEDSSLKDEQLNQLPTLNPPVSLLALGFGTSEGSTITTQFGGYLRDDEGNLVVTKRREDTLSRIADFFGGVYREAQITENDIAPFLITIFGDSLLTQGKGQVLAEGDEAGESVRIYDEKGPMVCLSVLLVLCALVTAGWHRVLLCSVLFVGAVAGSPIAARSDSLEGRDANDRLSGYGAYQAYRRGDYEAAKEGFRDAQISDPTNLDLAQGEASALFRTKEFEASAERFGAIARAATEPQQRFEALYNRGNALLAQQRYADAISAYDDALVLNPTDEPTLSNRALAEQLKLEEQKQKEQKKNDSQKKDSEQKDSGSVDQKSGQQREDNQGGEEKSSNDDSQEGSENQDKSSQETGNEADKRNENSETKSDQKSGEGKEGDRGEKAADTASEEPDQGPAGAEKEGDEPKKREDAGEAPAQKGTYDTSSDAPAQPGAQNTPSSAPSSETRPDQSIPDSPDTSAKEGPHPPSDADRWLASLPEAPVLLRRFDDGDYRPGEQAW